MRLPILRFKNDKGFNFPDGEIKPLGEVATLFNGRAYKQTEWKKEGTPVIRLQNLTGSSNNFYYSDLKLPENQYCYKGDLLYMWSATFGPVWWGGDKAIYHYHIWKIETETSRLSKQYLFYVLGNVTASMKNTSNGAIMDHITKGGMEKYGIYLPDIKEQNKITSFLRVIDEKVSQLTQKLDLLTKYKKGLMQKIFSQTLRFKDNDDIDFPDWKRKKFSDLISIVRGKNIALSENGKNILLGMGSVSEKGKLLNGKRTESEDFLITGDLVMPERDIGVGLIIGRAALIDREKTYVLGSNLLCLKVTEFLDSKFAYYFINSDGYNKQIKKITQGSAQLMITSQEVKKTFISFPCLKEQSKIAKFLSVIDEKITVVESQLYLVKKYKQGLMQKMFI
jgi:type I restriction enzyme, S subunit